MVGSIVAREAPVACAKRAHGCRRLRGRRARHSLACVCSTAEKVIIVGGTGRVGLSTASALVADTSLTLAGRSEANFRAAQASRPELKAAAFRRIDMDAGQQALVDALRGFDLVIHAAGPFQRRPQCDVLEAALQAGVRLYVDVCDDTEYARNARGLHARAQAAGLRGITGAGIFPGVSNIMALEMVRQGAAADSTGTPKTLSYSYYTAGTGGAGATILATNFLLLAEDALVYRDGKEVRMPPVSGRRVIDFGPKGGRRETFLYALPEVMMAHTSLGVPNVAARFGTSPGIWNGALAAMATIVPRSVLQDPQAALGMARALDPLVRAVDSLVGETTAMRVDLEMSSGTKSSGRFVHRRLSQAVGNCVAAFARDLLEHRDSDPGVWYPEDGVVDAPLLLQRASVGTLEYVNGKASWQLESKATQLGFGLYLE